MSTFGDHPKTCGLWGGGHCTCPALPAARVADATPDEPISTPSSDGRKLRRRSLDDVKIVPTRYLWADYLPVAELAMLVGKPGVGKSTVAADVAAQLTTGDLAGSFRGRPQHVLYSLTEDSESVFKGRFLAADGDPRRLTVLDVVHGQSDGSPLLVDADLDQLRAAIVELRPALVVLDALNSSLDGQQNDNSNIRPQLEKLKALAHQTGAAILGIGHFRKSTNGSEPLDSIGGAGAYGQVIRQALGCARDEDEGTCTLSVIKTNGQGLDVASLAYRIEEATVPADDGGTASVGRVTWLGESETTVRDLLQRTPQGDDDRHERDEAVDWLLSYLATCGGEAPSKDIFKAARSENIAERTLKRARSRAGVDYERTGFPSVTYWRISQSGHSRASQAKVPTPGPTGPTVARLDESSTKSAKSAKSAGPETPLPSVLPSSGAHLQMADCGHPASVTNPANGRCALCISARLRAVRTCRACAQPLDPAVGDDIHPFCDIEESA